jgi:hypothetical protein
LFSKDVAKLVDGVSTEEEVMDTCGVYDSLPEFVPFAPPGSYTTILASIDESLLRQERLDALIAYACKRDLLQPCPSDIVVGVDSARRLEV